MGSGDVDGDSWPDLFLAGFADTNNRTDDAATGFPGIYLAVPDRLLLSDGGADGRPTFSDVAAEVGVETDRRNYGLGALFSDVDRDGDLDLYVANDTQPNRLYVNEPRRDAPGFRLVDQAGRAGVADDGSGMGVAAGDYDNDGLPDLTVTNETDELHPVFRSTIAVGGADPPSYELALADLGLPLLGMGDTGWGTTWADIDLDGDLDLVNANGMIPVRDLEEDREQLRVYENDDGTFTDATASIGLSRSGRHLARGLAAADYDNDGDIDLAVGTVGGDLALLRNTGAGGSWLTVGFATPLPGTVVTAVLEDGSVLRRELAAGGSYLSSEDPRAHFGLGAHTGVDELVIGFPDGGEIRLVDVEAGQLLEIDPDDAR